MSTVFSTKPPGSFRSAERHQESILAPIERKALAWLASHISNSINPDHLTILGLVALGMAGACYAAATQRPSGLLLVNFWLAVNWLGDSLDGTLARYRRQQRPRYGFYVDHIVDSFGALFVLGGLAWSGLMSERIAFALLIAFLLLSIDSYLAAYTREQFRLSFWLFSPTELRILLALGNVAAFWKPTVILFGHQQRLFDVGGKIGVVCMGFALLANVFRNTAALYAEEKVPHNDALDKI